MHSLGAWLHAIAHNTALAQLRSRPAGSEYRGQDRASYDPPEDANRVDALVAALLSLPTRQREAM